MVSPPPPRLLWLASAQGGASLIAPSLEARGVILHGLAILRDRRTYFTGSIRNGNSFKHFCAITHLVAEEEIGTYSTVIT
jgi:hypothetical protein